MATDVEFYCGLITIVATGAEGNGGARWGAFSMRIYKVERGPVSKEKGGIPPVVFVKSGEVIGNKRVRGILEFTLCKEWGKGWE